MNDEDGFESGLWLGLRLALGSGIGLGPGSSSSGGGTKRRRGRSSCARAGAVPAFEACEKALAQALILSRVMSYIGESHDAFIATVSKEWKDHYRRAHSAKRTSRRCVVESAAHVHWAKRFGCKLNEETFKTAAKHGDVEVCKALHEEGCAWDTRAWRKTVFNRQHGLSVLQWLLSQDLPGKERCWSERICGYAGRAGNLEMLKWLISEEGGNAPFTSHSWLYACKGGNVAVVEYLLNHPRTRALLEENADEQWGWGTLRAAEEGHLGVLQLLHANARDLCDWDEGVCLSAVMHAESLATLKWLRSEEVQCAWDAGSCPQCIRDEGIYEDFHDQDEEWGISADTFEEIKQWVHVNGHPCDCQD